MMLHGFVRSWRLNQPSKMMRACWLGFVVAVFCFAAPSVAGPLHGRHALDSAQTIAPTVVLVAGEIRRQELDTDLFALMSGRCSTLKIAGRDFACRSVAYFHSEQGRANFTIALDDPTDASHVIAFSGENAQRTQDNLYE